MREAVYQGYGGGFFFKVIIGRGDNTRFLFFV